MHVFSCVVWLWVIGYLQKTISISLYSSLHAFLEVNDTVPFSRIAARGFSFLFMTQLSQPGIGSLKASVSPPLQRPNYFATSPAEIFIEILQDLDFVPRQHLRRVCKWWELLSRLPRMLENVHIDARSIGVPGSSCECASPFLGRLMTAAWSERQQWSNATFQMWINRANVHCDNGLLCVEHELFCTHWGASFYKQLDPLLRVLLADWILVLRLPDVLPPPKKLKHRRFGNVLSPKMAFYGIFRVVCHD